MNDLLKNTTFLIVLSVAILALFLTGFLTYKLYTTKDITEIQAEAAKWKAEYDQIVLVRDTDKKAYEQKITELQQKYSDQVKKYKNIVKEIENVKNPTTDEERVQRLHNLGWIPIPTPLSR